VVVKWGIDDSCQRLWVQGSKGSGFMRSDYLK
jgi:hypothetical protein